MEGKDVSVRAICALSVEFHVQRLGYMYIDAGPNKHDNIDWIIALAEISTKEDEKVPIFVRGPKT